MGAQTKLSAKQILVAGGLLLSGVLVGQAGTGRQDRWVPTGENYENEDRLSIRPTVGFVPDAKTALRIARAILERHVPAEEIQDGEPFVAKDMGGYWVVYGYFPEPKDGPPPVGGTVVIEIDRESGAILRLSREK